MKRKLSLSALEKKLDRIFSEWVRRRAADEGGTVECVTCGKLMHWKESHAGHFIKRQHRGGGLRHHPLNVHVQCVRCNVYMGGQQDEYAAYILRKYGAETLDELMRIKHIISKPDRSFLEEQISRYSGLLKDMERQAA